MYTFSYTFKQKMSTLGYWPRIIKLFINKYRKNSLRTNDVSHTCTPLIDRVHVWDTSFILSEFLRYLFLSYTEIFHMGFTEEIIRNIVLSIKKNLGSEKIFKNKN